MIELGKKKGAPNESHFVIKTRLTATAPLRKRWQHELVFDIYADTAQEAESYMKEYLDQLFSSHHFTRKEGVNA